MNEIKKLLIKRKFKTKFLNFLRYIKRLLLNKGIITIFSKNRIPFSDIWKKEIVKNLKTKKNWRGGRKEFLEWIDFLTFQKIFSLLSKSNNTIVSSVSEPELTGSIASRIANMEWRAESKKSGQIPYQAEKYKPFSLSNMLSKKLLNNK
mgnify:CR=1 FL=1